MKRIVCPFDFSDAAENAAEYAAQLAKRGNMHLRLLHIDHIATWHGVVPLDGGVLPYVDDEAADTEERLKSYAAGIEERFGVSCDSSVKVYAEPLALSLGKEVAADDVELVVMGTRGADDAIDKLVGTNTYQAIRKMNKPFLLVPGACAFKPILKVLYATDYSPADGSNIRHLLELTKPYRVTILHITKKGTLISDEVFQCFRDVLEDEFGEKRPLVFKRTVGEDIPALLREAMAGEDLLVLLAKQYNVFQKVFHRSTIRRLSFLADFPILIYPNPPSHGAG